MTYSFVLTYCFIMVMNDLKVLDMVSLPQTHTPTLIHTHTHSPPPTLLKVIDHPNWWNPQEHANYP